jgi:cytochrome P450
VSCGHREHRRLRWLVQPAFHRDRIPGYARVMTERIAAVTEPWQDGQVLDVLAVMNALALAVAARTLFTAEVDESALIEIRRCARDVLTGVTRRVVMPWAWPTPKFTTSVLTFFFGGSGTVSATLSWVWHLLGCHPDIQARLHTEVDTVLDGRIAEYHDIPKLTLTGQIITESLRLYPPVWLSTRRTTTDAELAGQHLPAGTIVVFSPYVLHHYADLYPDPNRFDPDRWRDDTTHPLPRGSQPAGEGLSSSRRHYPNVPRPLRRGVLHGCASRLYTAALTFALSLRAQHSLAPPQTGRVM